MFHIAPIDHRSQPIAQCLHAMLVLAHAQEMRLVERDETGLPASRPARSAGEIQGCDEHFLGALCGDELVGSLSVGADEEQGQIQVLSLVVHPGHQRRGVARLLMLEALARGNGSPFSVVAAAANAPALALYQALGFVAYRHGTLGPEQVAMVKLRRELRAGGAAGATG